MVNMDLVTYDSGIEFGTKYLTKETAFFLGGIFSSNECVNAGHDLYWIAPVRYNYHYATNFDIEQHLEYIKMISSEMGAQTIMADNVRGTFLDSGKFRLPGFGTFFKANCLSHLHDEIPNLKKALYLSPWDVRRSFIAGLFDGRGSIDINKSTHKVRYIVLDCPTNEIGSFLSNFLKDNGFQCNYNTARDRLEGGAPRKPQLRIKNDDDYMRQIGFISPKRFQLISNAYMNTYREVITINADEILPGLKCISMR